MRAANLNESLNSTWRENGRLQRAWRWLAIAWLLVLVGLGVQQWQLWSKESRIDTDILALLPQDAHDRLLSDVTRRIADANSRQVVVLLGSADAAQTKAAEAAFRKEMTVERGSAPLVQESGSIEGWFDEARAFYAPYRDRLLTDQQRQRLQDEPADSLSESA
ncbi:MAG: MMPL family transporter, partial [Stenotrophomonas sp.]